MRRLLVLAVALVAVLGVQAPPAMAQAPAPKVTITGFIDEVFTYGKNLSDYDNNYSRQKDTQATDARAAGSTSSAKSARPRRSSASSSMPSTGRRVTTTRSSTPGAA